MAYRILVAEDEEITLKHLLYALEREGYEAVGVGDGLAAWQEMEKGRFDVLITDLKMPGLSGLELLDRIREGGLDTDVVLVTGYGSISSAVEAVKKGVYDYLTKPFDLDELVLKVGKLCHKRAMEKQNLALRVFSGMDREIPVIAVSRGMKRILTLVEEMRESECSVLLTGESGVGKGLLAKIIHSSSRRSAMPFLQVNCATLTEELLASELFGHEKGAFTGASQSKKGLVEIADTGTLFLDEIAEIPPKLQAKLLRVIEDGEFLRVGGTKTLRVDVRFIAATNRHVQTMISEGDFREDLYYRLNVMEIFVPPLRERRGDIKPLAEYFLEKYVPRSSKKIKGFAEEAMTILMDYGFPGNVRELENIVERAIILEKGELISPASLPQAMKVFKVETVEPGHIRTLEELTKDYVQSVVDVLGGNKTRASELLGISRTSLWRILKEE